MKITNSTTGAASMFVVIFTTLLLGIISLGFISIMISEANQTTDFDLSQSAYDSALAGVEDAKIALLKYHECLSRGDYTSFECNRAINAMVTGYNPENCDIVQQMLGRPIDHIIDESTGLEIPVGTIIQSEHGDDLGDTATLMQAYTCVRIEENTDDYLGMLNQNYRTKLIPIRTTGPVGDVDRIRLSWYDSADSDKVDAADAGIYNTIINPALPTLTTNKEGYSFNYRESSTFSIFAPAPPVLQFQLIQAATSFTLAQFDVNSGDRSNRGNLLLRPGEEGVNLIPNRADIGLAGSADRSFNNPIDIDCDPGGVSYRCVADIVIPQPVGGTRGDGTMFVRLVLPYNMPDTSFSIELYNCGGGASSNTADTADCTRMQFAGVQTRVDSTGRANDLFRRIETRVEMVDVYYPMPEFAVDISGGGDNGIKKNFWVTQNCWYTNPNNHGRSCVNVEEF